LAVGNVRSERGLLARLVPPLPAYRLPAHVLARANLERRGVRTRIWSLAHHRAALSGPAHCPAR